MSMNDLFNLLSKRFDSNDAKFEEQNIKFDIINCRFDEINKQNAKFEVNMNKRLNEMNECVNTIKEQIVESIGERIKSNSNNDNKKVTCDRNNVENDNIIKKVVSESDDIIVGEGVIESERVMGCKWGETNVNQLEREYEESTQRVKFSRDVFVGEENASREYLGDVWSTNNCPLIFCVSGKVRCCSNRVVPSVWSEIMKCCGIESNYERERVIELFRLSRDYESLVVEINVERSDYSKNSRDLPCLRNNVYINDKYLPVGRSNVSVVAEYGNNDVMVITKNTDGDFIKNTDVDFIYE